MCVIISRKPKIVIPSDMIESACEVNQDGFGISVVDRGKIETFKEYTKEGNDPERILKLLEDAKDHHVYLHLRYTTRGTKDTGNCHPFPLTTLTDDGLDSFFMHNGTLSKFHDATNGRSDSFVFARDVLAPLSALIHRGCKEDTFLKNGTLRRVLEDYAGTGSVFTLYDMDGNELIIDQSKQGKAFDGWWASNEYSFNRWHRTPRYTSYSGYSSTQGQSVVPFNQTKGTSTTSSPTSTTSGSGNGGSTSPSQQTSLSLSEQCEIIGAAANKIKEIRKANPLHTPPSKRHTFCELAGIDSLQQVELLSEEDIEDIVDQAPEAATLLILDLIYELYQARKGTPEAQMKMAANG